MRMFPAVVLAIVSILLSGLLYRKSMECKHQSERIETLYAQAKGLEHAVAVGEQRADSLSMRLAALSELPSIDHLRKRGLQDPVSDLIRDLQHHPELIPYTGGFGGRMGFYHGNLIRILNGLWVYAPFDDGHVSGDAIFDYQVAAGGAISWRLLVTRFQGDTKTWLLAPGADARRE